MLKFEFVRDSKLRNLLIQTAAGAMVNAEDANNALYALMAEGERVLKEWVGKRFYDNYFPTNRHGGHWKNGRPVGVVDHYTAGLEGARACRWFSSRARNPGEGSSSAHFVVEADGRCVVLVDPLTHIAYHATWANKDRVGIEHVNAGVLQEHEGAYFYQNVHPYPRERTANKRVEISGGEPWEVFSTAQVVMNVVIKRLLIATLDTMDPTKFVDHQQIDPRRKRDCGPMWPLWEVNKWAFSNGSLLDLDGLAPTWMSKNARAVFHGETQDMFGEPPGQ